MEQRNPQELLCSLLQQGWAHPKAELHLHPGQREMLQFTPGQRAQGRDKPHRTFMQQPQKDQCCSELLQRVTDCRSLSFIPSFVTEC